MNESHPEDPDKETLYFGDLYSYSKLGQLDAVVTRGGDTPGTVNVHVDNIDRRRQRDDRGY